MFSRIFWRDLLERSLSTFAEAFGAYILAAGVTDVVHLNWVGAASTAGLATLLAAFKGIAAGRLVGDSKSASLDPEQKILGKA